MHQSSALSLLSSLIFATFAVACASTSAVPDATAAAATASTAAAGAEAAAETALALDDVATVNAELAKGAPLVDVRPAGRYAQGHHPGAVSIPWDQVDGRMTEIEALTGGDKSKPVVVACGNGSQAVKVRDKLKASGWTQVYAQAVPALVVPAEPTKE